MAQQEVPESNAAEPVAAPASLRSENPSRAAPEPRAGATIVHATTIVQGDAGLLITGRSGSGKSALALQCIGLGARLVADDRTALHREANALRAAPPSAIAGLIEVRGLGLLRLPHATDVALRAVVDLDTEETERLPPYRETHLMGVALPLYRRLEGAHFAAALLLCLAGAREAPPAPNGPAR